MSRNGSAGRPVRRLADGRRRSNYESLRKDAERRGFRLSRRGETYRILGPDSQIVLAGTFDVAAASLSTQTHDRVLATLERLFMTATIQGTRL